MSLTLLRRPMCNAYSAPSIAPSQSPARGGSGSGIHPMLPRDTETDSRGRALYHCSMRLPACGDRRGILKFLGLADDMADRLLDAPPQPGRAEPDTQFPVVDKLLLLYLDRPGAAHGLIPEFAAECGRVEISPCFIAPGLASGKVQPQFFTNCVSINNPFARVEADRIVKNNAALLKDLWRQKQAAEEVAA